MKLSELGDKIRELRKAKELTQETLAKKAEISRATLSKLENGYFSKISVATLENILSILGYSLNIEAKNPFIKR